jgi:hypothetical protein
MKIIWDAEKMKIILTLIKNKTLVIKDIIGIDLDILKELSVLRMMKIVLKGIRLLQEITILMIMIVFIVLKERF